MCVCGSSKIHGVYLYIPLIFSCIKDPNFKKTNTTLKVVRVCGHCFDWFLFYRKCLHPCVDRGMLGKDYRDGRPERFVDLSDQKKCVQQSESSASLEKRTVCVQCLYKCKKNSTTLELSFPMRR